MLRVIKGGNKKPVNPLQDVIDLYYQLGDDTLAGLEMLSDYIMPDLMEGQRPPANIIDMLVLPKGFCKSDLIDCMAYAYCAGIAHSQSNKLLR